MCLNHPQIYETAGLLMKIVRDKDYTFRVSSALTVKKSRSVSSRTPLSARARANKFRQWKRQFKIIRNQITELALRRFIYREVTKLIQENPRLQVRSAFYDWMHSVYVTDMAMSIRRLVDWNKRTISFIRLMEDMKRHPEVISRRRFTHPYKNFMKQYGHRDYERFAKPGQNILDRRLIAFHRRTIVRSQKKIRHFLNNHIAHSNKYKRRQSPTRAELEMCLDTLEILMKEYALLFERVALLNVAPVIQYDWMAPFRVAWLQEKTIR